MAEKSLTPLGQYLDQARRRCGIKISDLMRRSGLNRATWYNLIEGKGTPQAETVRRLAQVLDADVGYALRLAFADSVSAGRDLAQMTDTEILDLITAGTAELRRRAGGPAACPEDRTGLPVAQPA